VREEGRRPSVLHLKKFITSYKGKGGLTRIRYMM